MRRVVFSSYPRLRSSWGAVFRAASAAPAGPHADLSPPPQPRALTTPEAEIVGETIDPRRGAAADGGPPSEDGVRLLREEEHRLLELHKLRHWYSQDGAYVGSRVKDAVSAEVDRRRRRAVLRVPQPDLPYQPNETSFRRLPKHVRLPNEFELRAMYPLSTSLALVEGKADCVDHSAFGVEEAPLPISYSMLAPPDWSPGRSYPYLVVLSDHRGVPRDFEDVCANFFERPVHFRLMSDQQWVVLAPVINMRHNFQVPVEGIVARFCDWVGENFNVEHGRVHLFGKGYGGYVALRTVLDYKDVAISVTAILGRNNSPFRPFDRPQDRIKNFNGVHSLVFVPGLLRKQDYYYKFKLMMDMGRVRPPLRNIHFADVWDHQIYYAINPYEFWNYMRYFREFNMKMITESGYSI
ncbi:unnamed protein product [Phytomonas sp. Hart1]|nr:unnamed protein product [Phytomonas sp. Hart1]|eukprot:CCW70734.1 unnamed protein product [Phytomonas sp. isolate Hart1]